MPVDEAEKAEIAAFRKRLRALQRSAHRRLIASRIRAFGFRLESLRLRLVITILKLPDYLSAFLLIFYRRRHRSAP